MKDEFKMFVKNRPELISYVSKGEMTWQKFYEIWSLYGEDEKVWKKYKTNEENNNSKEGFNFSSLIEQVKKVDMNSVQKGITSMQKAVELLQGLVLGGSAKEVQNKNSYEPRRLFKKFED